MIWSRFKNPHFELNISRHPQFRALSIASDSSNFYAAVYTDPIAQPIPPKQPRPSVQTMQYLPMPLREGQGIPPIPKSQKKPTHFIHPKKTELCFRSKEWNHPYEQASITPAKSSQQKCKVKRKGQSPFTYRYYQGGEQVYVPSAFVEEGGYGRRLWPCSSYSSLILMHR